MPPKKKTQKSEEINNLESEIQPIRALRPRKVTHEEPKPKSKGKSVSAKNKEVEKPVKRGRKAKDVDVFDEDNEPSEKLAKNDNPENGTIKGKPTKKSKAEKPNNEDIDEFSDSNDNASKSIYEFSAKTINGDEISLDKYKGHVCIIVNVASKCGHTSSNYKEFVELFNKYGQEKGLRILAFPCNQFGKQEPGDNEKICEFAKKKNVKFDMFEKIEVNGKNAHPLWKYLKSEKEGPKGENIDWNFTKFLINKEGRVVDRFKPSVKPLTLANELENLW